MKTYLKRSHNKALETIFYSSLDTLKHFPTRVKYRQHIIQPSTKEQQRLLSSSSRSPRIQHVHSGKYGIRPIWPSDKLSCEQSKHGKKLNKVILISKTINTCINIYIHTHTVYTERNESSCLLHISEDLVDLY